MVIINSSQIGEKCRTCAGQSRVFERHRHLLGLKRNMVTGQLKESH